MPFIPKSSSSTNEYHDGHHRFEHWYRDNQVYFLTAHCKDRVRAFAFDEAKEIFWDCFDRYTKEFSFTPWVTTLIDNHYHSIGYQRIGEELKEMMRKLHGSVAKRVNDVLEVRLVPFWGESKHKKYMDGCIRDELQARRAYRYTLTQSVRHGITRDWTRYPHTHVEIDIDIAVKRAHELNAFLTGVPYPRYEKKKTARPQGH